MWVGVDAREICECPAGKGQYVQRLVVTWLEQTSFPLNLYVKPGQVLPDQIQGFARNYPDWCKIMEVSGLEPLWHWNVARRLARDNVTVYFAGLSNFSAICNSIPTVTVVHDLVTFKVKGIKHNTKALIGERLALKAGVRRSARIIAVSDSTRRDLVEVTRVTDSKVRVIGEGPMLNCLALKPLPLEERRPFMLFVGTLEPRKNIATLLRAYAALPQLLRDRHHLKLAGKPGWGGEDYVDLAQQLGISDRVEFLGYVANSDLIQLYREATALVYPSIYEGFGLPPLEAMSVGTPVITSNTSSLPEVVGEAAILCDPLDAATVTRAMQKLLEQPELQSTLAKAGYARAQQFNWTTISQQVASVLYSV